MPHTKLKNRVPVPTNPAVQRCRAAWDRTFDLALTVFDEEPGDAPESIDEANSAFRMTMPSLDSFENIRDFIACVAYALTANIIKPQESTRYLYAAQVALSIHRFQAKSPAEAAGLNHPPPPRKCPKLGAFSEA